MEKNFAPDPGGVQQVLTGGRSGREEEPQDRRRADVPPLDCPAGPDPEDPRRGHGPDPAHPRLPHGFRVPNGSLLGPIGKRTAVANPLRWAFLWASSGILIELMIHQIDECCWIKDGWPVAAHGVGGRAPNSHDCSQNLDSYSIEYTFADGTKAMVTGRYIPNCHNEFATFVHGTKCAAQFSGDPSPIDRRPTRTSGSPPTTSTGGRRRRSIPGRPSGMCFWTPSATTGRTTRPSGRPCEPGGHHGAGRGPLRQDHHLGRGDGLEVPVLPERGQTHRG